MNIIQTEYSFKKVFYHLKDAIADSVSMCHTHVCIMDDTTFGFVKFEAECKKQNIEPVFGLRVMVIRTKAEKRDRFEAMDEIYIVAKSEQGISDLYKIYSIATSNKYYNIDKIYYSDLMGMDIMMLDPKKYCIPIARYSSPNDIATYQCITGSRGIPTHKQYALTDEELLEYFTQDQIDEKNSIPGYIENDTRIPKSGMIKYNGDLDFAEECWEGLFQLGLFDNFEYKERLRYEIDMILSKDFQDYFMIVSEMIKDAKNEMIVGPGRGSSGGSLVCYALNITNIDPIRFGLIFERFIDINRSDFPDIDTDYPDTKRHIVLERLRKRYKTANKLGTISKYKPKTVINDFAKEYKIPAYDLTELKDSIIERSSGDARAEACLADSFDGTEIGRAFIEKHPCMRSTERAEGHSRHNGTHAAGIIVLDEDINNYAAIDLSTEVICMEGPDAESIGLLKIDALGLRTLSVIENCLRLSDRRIDEIYSIDLENPDVFSVFNNDDLSDIFQFDGDAIRMVNRSINVSKFSDLSAITALGRPGALNSGGTTKYTQVGNGDREPEYFGDIYKKITEATNGIVVYQEQTMVLLREYGNLSWKDVNIMRKIISKSRGDEFFNKYKQKFIIGAKENGYDEISANIVWDAIASMGSYAFNKSHAVAYAMISYWCAYCKIKYPLNFLAANLNNCMDDAHGLKMLRQYVKKYDLNYVPVDPDTSEVGWSFQDGVLTGGLTNLKGIGIKKAEDIIKRRNKNLGYTPSIVKKLLNPITPYDELYPMEVKYKEFYESYNITRIEEFNNEAGKSTTIGKITMKDLRDRNDLQSVMKRDGRKVDTNTHYLNIIIEDDTGSIKCTIAPFDMDKLEGMKLAETLAINDVIAVEGIVREGWQNISVTGIKKI